MRRGLPLAAAAGRSAAAGRRLRGSTCATRAKRSSRRRPRGLYGVYSNRARGAGEPKQPGEETAPKRKRCTASWARLIHKVYGADPMICRQCGSKLRVIAFITDSLSIKQVLEPLGLWSDENQRPPPEPREVRVVPVDDAGREIGEAW